MHANNISRLDISRSVNIDKLYEIADECDEEPSDPENCSNCYAYERVQMLEKTSVSPNKVWVYMPHGYAGPVLTYDKQFILDEMANDLEAAKEEEPEPGNSWNVTDTHIYVDDGYGEAWLVDLPIP